MSQTDKSAPKFILIDSLTNHLQYLKKVQQDVYGPLCHFTFPSKQLILFYQKRMLPKMKARQKSCKTIVVSDILYWFAPQLVGFVHRIEKYMKGFSKTTQNRLSSLKSVMPQINQNQLSQQDLLRVPQIYLQQSIITQIKSYIKYSKNKQLNKQSDSLKRFCETYEALIQKYGRDFQMTSQEVEQAVLGQLYEDVPESQYKIAQKYIFRVAFLAKLKLRTKKANKRLQQRKMKILQLIDGQRNYVQGLQQYIKCIKNQIIALNILHQDQQYKLFSTIESILQIHQQFHKQLQTKYDKYDKYQTFGDIIKKNFPFFQIYIDYIFYADQAQAMLVKLIQDHPEDVGKIYSQFLNVNQKNAIDQLKQPTFRIARYQNILAQIIKYTNTDHPDYQKLLQAQKTGIAGLRKINQTVDRMFRSNRLNQLEQQFGTQQRPIFEQKRQFMDQFNLFFVKDQKLEPVIVFVFSDFVMVIDEHRKIIKWVNIDENFYVRRQEDNKIYRNIIKIHSQGFLTFSAGSQDKHFNKAEQFYQLLQRVSKQNQQSSRMVYVQVIGTQQIGSTSFAKHTQYIVQIKCLGLRKFVHIRFSQMKPLVNRIKSHYKNQLNITNEQALHKNWFNNHKSKTIEDRKRTIQQILQKMLNHQVVKNDPDYILGELGIENNFFVVNSISPQKKRQTMVQSNMKVSRTKFRPSKKQFKEAETILCATQIKLGRDVFHDIDQMSILQKKANQPQKIDIYVNTQVEQDPIIVRITQSFTVEDVCHKVSKLIGLKMNRDFRLFHEIGKKQLRVLDPQQKIMKIFTFPKKQIKTNGPFASFLQPLKRIIAPDSHPILVFKKYYFLPVEIQQSQCKKDLTRLRLLVYQIFTEIKQMKYQLSFDQYLLFLALMIYIQYDGEVPDQLDSDMIHRLIPQTIFKLKNYSQMQWITKCRPHIIRIRQQIQKIILYNRQQLKDKKINMDSVSKTALYFGHKHLCSQIVLNKIKSNPIYGSNLFYVQPYKSTYQKLVKQGCKMAYNMWLAIKVQSLNLLTPSSKQTVLQLKYSDIQKIFVYSQAIIFKMDGILTQQYRLNTYQSFQISQLVKYNKALNDTLNQLQRNQDLIQKARMYKQELLIYRNTYDKNQTHESKIQEN